MKYASDVAFSPAVKAVQEMRGSRASYAKVEQGHGWSTKITPELEKFLSSLDMFYLATANSDGQPYIQYRGGPTGFLRVMDDRTLGFADFGGNRQYITVGNLSENPKAFIFLIDYVHRRRVKIWGRARVVEDDSALSASLSDPSYSAKVERSILFDVEAWDVNCPQHIHQRLPLSEVEAVLDSLRGRIADLEAQLAAVGGDFVPAANENEG